MKDAMEVKATASYKETSLDETLRGLGTSAQGLAAAEAHLRSLRFGYNEVSEKRRHPLLSFLARYWGTMPWLLEAAAVLAIFLRHYLEAGIILGLLTVNSIVGQIQATGSQRALAALKQRLAMKARALRDGVWTTLEAREIVPGDIVSVGLGDIVPADAKLIEGSLSLDQSALTGESLPADARPSAVVYSGSVVRRGEARCVVVNTGSATYIGRTAELVKTARPVSHQEQIMLAIVRYMMYLGLAALVLVAGYSAIIGESALSILTFAVIFLMGSVPVALPAVLTIVQAVGATELARKGVLVTRLDSVEDAASVDILCLDKTGTITQNRLSVGQPVPWGSYSAEDVARVASLASQSQSKDAIDEAVLEHARASRVALDGYRQISFTPFEPASKRSEALIEGGGVRFKASKGAPQTLLSLSSDLSQEAKAQAFRMVEELSRKGYRTLGVARSDDEAGPLRFVGLMPLADPPRPDSKEMIEGAKSLGVRPMMLTGDNIAIAREIAAQVAIGSKIVSMEEFRKLDSVRQGEMAEEIDGFAEIYPEDKFRIVKLLQSRGHMVAMTGDGVNDAPALKQAEMGIAVSSATDVAKASASTVLTEAGVAVIIEAIRTSRHIYQRMLTWVINKVTKVIQVIGLLTVGFFWFRQTVLSLLGMALLIFANDFVTMSLATDNVRYTASPNRWRVDNIMLASLVVGAGLVVEGVIALFVGQVYFHLDFRRLRTLALLTLVFTSQFRVFIVRERRHFWSSRPGRALLIATSAALVVFALLGIYGLIIPSLPSFAVLFALALSAFFTFAMDYPKYRAFKMLGL
jgi:H+-transporting ATPase